MMIKHIFLKKRWIPRSAPGNDTTEEPWFILLCEYYNFKQNTRVWGLARFAYKAQKEQYKKEKCIKNAITHCCFPMKINLLVGIQQKDL